MPRMAAAGQPPERRATTTPATIIATPSPIDSQRTTCAGPSTEPQGAPRQGVRGQVRRRSRRCRRAGCRARPGSPARLQGARMHAGHDDGDQPDAERGGAAPAAHEDDRGQEDRHQLERRVDGRGQAAGRGAREEERHEEHLDAAHVALPERVEDRQEPGRGGAEPEDRLRTQPDAAGPGSHQDARRSRRPAGRRTRPAVAVGRPSGVVGDQDLRQRRRVAVAVDALRRHRGLEHLRRIGAPGRLPVGRPRRSSRRSRCRTGPPSAASPRAPPGRPLSRSRPARRGAPPRACGSGRRRRRAAQVSTAPVQGSNPSAGSDSPSVPARRR